MIQVIKSKYFYKNKQEKWPEFTWVDLSTCDQCHKTMTIL
jgi:hypothetical protein